DDVPHLDLGQPGGPVGGHPGPDDPGLVAADDIVSQRGAGGICVPDFSEGDQPQLDEG
ncbi:UBA domain-containing protein, partial [Dysosmobacter welbionis]